MATYAQHLVRELAAARRAGIRHNGLMIAGVVCAAMSGLCLGTLAPLPAVTVSVEIVAIDSMGEAWTVGSGDDCNAAWRGAWEHVPVDWVEVECVPVTLRDLIAR